jgi:hypothetical protein
MNPLSHSRHVDTPSPEDPHRNDENLGRALAEARRESAEQGARMEALTAELAQSARLIAQLASEVRSARHDLLVMEAHTAELRTLLRETHVGATEHHRLMDRLASVMAELSLAREHSAALSAQLAACALDNEGYRTTLALPRYRLADRLNRALRVVRPLHRLLKVAVLLMVRR